MTLKDYLLIEDDVVCINQKNIWYYHTPDKDVILIHENGKQFNNLNINPDKPLTEQFDLPPGWVIEDSSGRSGIDGTPLCLYREYYPNTFSSPNEEVRKRLRYEDEKRLHWCVWAGRFTINTAKYNVVEHRYSHYGKTIRTYTNRKTFLSALAKERKNKIKK